MRYLAITSPDINNGLGCRATLWVSGCSHHCPGCQNPETWDYDKGMQLLSEATYNKVFDALEKPYIAGLTISGGDPLSQSEDNLLELKEFIQNIKYQFPDKNIWIYAGDTFEEIVCNPYKRAIIELCDVLVEGPYIQEQRNITIPFRGSNNQRIINLKDSLIWGKAVILPIE